MEVEIIEDLTEEEMGFIDDEMNAAIEETIKEINDEIENDEELKKEVDDIFATDDIKERVDIFKKYHPEDTMFE